MCQPCMMVRKEIEDREKNKVLEILAERFNDYNDKYNPDHDIHYGRAGKLVYGCNECDQIEFWDKLDRYIEGAVDRTNTIWNVENSNEV